MRRPIILQRLGRCEITRNRNEVDNRSAEDRFALCG